MIQYWTGRCGINFGFILQLSSEVTHDQRRVITASNVVTSHAS